MGKIISLLGPMRPRFLILTPACVFLGLGSALVYCLFLMMTYLSIALGIYFNYLP